YTIGKQGIAKLKLEDDSKDLTPLLDTILKYVPPAAAEGSAEKPVRAQPFNLAYDNYLGRLAIVRMYEGVLKTSDAVFVKHPTGETRNGKITKMFTFKGLQRVETMEVGPGDIAMVAGLPDIYIGETITTNEVTEPLPAIAIDEPTIALNFLVNNSPFAGREGKFVTSRQIRERLERELEVNVGLKVDFSAENIPGGPESFKVSGRGELHIAILLENMRREGYEMQVSQPQVIFHEENGEKLEPYEEVIVDTPQEYQGSIIERLGTRKFIMKDLKVHDSQSGAARQQARLTFEGPTRGLLGYRNQFVLDTKGEGIMSSRVVGFRPYAGEIKKKQVGSMISMATGKALGFSLWNLQDRGVLYIPAAVEVYEGMVIGNTSKGEEMTVNPTKNKNLTNVRSSGTDEALTLVPPFQLTIERGLEVMAEDEYLEITPTSVRLRKQQLTENDRTRARR
ncbi:MAG: EF-Tu/IF-2/RF-3 family GTPase, partial [bacterium]|nr:EF-Tu/IF-2/RF-3 family GTPase [bacterium]